MGRRRRCVRCARPTGVGRSLSRVIYIYTYTHIYAYTYIFVYVCLTLPFASLVQMQLEMGMDPNAPPGFYSGSAPAGIGDDTVGGYYGGAYGAEPLPETLEHFEPGGESGLGCTLDLPPDEQ